MMPDRNEKAERRFAKAKTTFDELQVYVDNKLWNVAVNRLYYACFYAVTALLYHHGLETKTHSGTRRLFGLHFISKGIINKKIGEFYSDLFEMRQEADYEDTIDYDEDDVLKLLQPAKELIAAIETELQQ